MTAHLRFGIALLLIAVSLTAIGTWLTFEVSLDRCLDAGGAWDQEHIKCTVVTE